MCYQGGQGKGGRQQIQEVARYPSVMFQSTNQQYCGPDYPSLVLPCNRIHLKLGGCSSRPGRVLNILALPDEFPLALSFAHCLSHMSAPPSGHSPLPHPHSQVLSALSVCLQSLTKFLNRISCLIPLKEVVLHQLSAIMWTMCCRAQQVGGGQAQDPSPSPSPSPYAFPSKFLQVAQQELLKLYEAESSKFSKSKPSEGKCSFPRADSIGGGGVGRYSTYFQALLEFVLAACEYQQTFHCSTSLPSSSSSSSPGPSPSSSATTLVSPCSSSSSGGGSTVGGPGGRGSTVGGPGGGGSTVGGPGGADAPSTSASSSGSSTSILSGPPLSPNPPTLSASRSDSSPSATPTSAAAPVVATATDPTAGKKIAKRTRSRKVLMKREASESSPKKEEWLNVVRQSSSLLRAVASCRATSPLVPTRPPSPAHPAARLVLLLGLPPTLVHDVVESAIRRTCKLYGGLYEDDLYLPVSADTVQHCGHAVLELCCDVHTSAVCSALLDSPSLQQEGHAPLQALAVNNLLSCGEQEVEAKAVLLGFLRWRLEKGAAKSAESAVLSALASIFKSSCPESVSALEVSQVSGLLLKFFSKFASLCAVSTENFMGGVWEEFASEKGLLDFDGFRKCYEQDFKLNPEYAMRGVWLGLVECGYDFHLDR